MVGRYRVFADDGLAREAGAVGARADLDRQASALADRVRYAAARGLSARRGGVHGRPVPERPAGPLAVGVRDRGLVDDVVEVVLAGLFERGPGVLGGGQDAAVEPVRERSGE